MKRHQPPRVPPGYSYKLNRDTGDTAKAALLPELAPDLL